MMTNYFFFIEKSEIVGNSEFKPCIVIYDRSPGAAEFFFNVISLRSHYFGIIMQHFFASIAVALYLYDSSYEIRFKSYSHPIYCGIYLYEPSYEIRSECYTFQSRF